MPDSPQLPQSLQFLVRSRRAARIATWRGRLWAVFWIGLIIAIAIVAPWFLGAGWRTGAIDVKYVWVQMLPDEDGLLGGRLARAIVTKGNRCPDVSQEGRTVNMVRRPSPLQSTFPILICEAKLHGDSDAWIGLRRLPPRPDNPQDVVVIGDTGCRMVYWEIQSCLSDDGWPFAAVAERAASRIKDDGHQFVVIHVGDYHYRENPCADQSKKCGGSPYGDNWETWEEEFFKPASPLLLVAPWVIMRGNHEDCARAGAGWIFFFGLPGSNGDDACEHELDSYTLAFGQAGSRRRVLTVLDTANSRSPYKIEDRCEIYRRWIMHIDDQVPIVWLALHQPLLSRSPDGVQSATTAEDDSCKQGDTTDALKVIRALLLSSPPARTVRLVLSGDTHVFQFFQPTNSERPIQIIAGMGGTALDKFKLLPKDENAKPADTENDRAQDEAVTSYGVTGGVLTIAKHGFVIMHNDGQSWTVKLVDAAGETLATCHFSEASSPNRPTNAGPDCDDKLGTAASTGGDGSPFP
jgi:hypothetical protein